MRTAAITALVALLTAAASEARQHSTFRVNAEARASNDGSYGALFQFNDHGRLALDSINLERREGFLFVFVNGRPIAELQIDRRVSDGKIYIASGLTTNEIALMKKDWPARAPRKR